MRLLFKRADLIEASNEYYIAHCIDKTASMGTSPTNGRTYPNMVAYQVNQKYGHKRHLQEFLRGFSESSYPRCIMLDNVFHLVTKNKHYEKPTYDTLRDSLLQMRELIKTNNIQALAIPKLGCGADGLEWEHVEGMIYRIFEQLEGTIIVCIK